MLASISHCCNGIGYHKRKHLYYRPVISISDWPHSTNPVVLKFYFLALPDKRGYQEHKSNLMTCDWYDKFSSLLINPTSISCSFTNLVALHWICPTATERRRQEGRVPEVQGDDRLHTKDRLPLPRQPTGQRGQVQFSFSQMLGHMQSKRLHI